MPWRGLRNGGTRLEEDDLSTQSETMPGQNRFQVKQPPKKQMADVVYFHDHAK